MIKQSEVELNICSRCKKQSTFLPFSLVKMVFSFAEKSKQPPTWFEMLHAIKRNFGGLEDIDPETRFRGKLTGRISINEQVHQWDVINYVSRKDN